MILTRQILSPVLLVVLLASPMILHAEMVVAQPEKPRYGGVIRLAMLEDPSNLNLALEPAHASRFVSSLIFDTLFFYDVGNKPVPKLAQSWTLSADGLTYTFNLVRNATFHDGKPLTSEDVKFSIELSRKLHPSGPLVWGNLDRIETPDAYTVVARLNAPFPPLPLMLGAFHGGVVPKHIYDVADPLKNPRNFEDPVGSGPFIIKEWMRGSHLVLERNPNYWREGLPYLDRIVVKMMPDAVTRFAAFDAGEVDYLIGFLGNHQEYERYSKTPGVKVSIAGSEAYGSISYAVQLNNREPRLTSDVNVRRAIAHAIDKKLLIDKASFGLGKVVDSVISPEIEWAHEPNVRIYEFDPAKANKILDEAGYPRKADGMRFTLDFPADPALSEEWRACEVIVSELREVGINARLITLEAAAMRDRVYKRYDYDLHLRGLGTGPDPAVSAMRRALHSQMIRPINYYNDGGYNNSRVDQLFDMAAVEPDYSKRAAYYSELQKIVAEEVPIIPIKTRADPQIWKDEFAHIPVGAYGGTTGGYEYMWWTKGLEMSPKGVASFVKDAESQIKTLQGQLYDVARANELLTQANKALKEANYADAYRLAKEALAAPTPPYALYGVVVAIVVVASAAMIYMRRRKTKPKT